MGFEEMKRLRDEAKAVLSSKPKDDSGRFKPSSAAAADNGKTKQSKEVARTIADKEHCEGSYMDSAKYLLVV